MKLSFVFSLILPMGRLKPSLSDASKSSESKSFSDNDPPIRFTRIGSSRFYNENKKSVGEKIVKIGEIMGFSLVEIFTKLGSEI